MSIPKETLKVLGRLSTNKSRDNYKLHGQQRDNYKEGVISHLDSGDHAGGKL